MGIAVTENVYSRTPLEDKKEGGQQIPDVTFDYNLQETVNLVIL